MAVGYVEMYSSCCQSIMYAIPHAVRPLYRFSVVAYHAFRKIICGAEIVWGERGLGSARWTPVAGTHSSHPLPRQIHSP